VVSVATEISNYVSKRVLLILSRPSTSPGGPIRRYRRLSGEAC